jgi:hypothetical protein
VCQVLALPRRPGIVNMPVTCGRRWQMGISKFGVYPAFQVDLEAFSSYYT